MCSYKKGDVIGKIIFSSNGNQLLEVNLVSDNDIEKNTLWNLTISLYKKWFNVLR